MVAEYLGSLESQNINTLEAMAMLNTIVLMIAAAACGFAVGRIRSLAEFSKWPHRDCD